MDLDINTTTVSNWLNFAIAPRRFEMLLILAHENQFETVKKVLLATANDNRILIQPALEITLEKLQTNSMIVALKSWTNNSNYGPVTKVLLEKIKINFDAAQIVFPLMQTAIQLGK